VEWHARAGRFFRSGGSHDKKARHGHQYGQPMNATSG
jgi:hypothetical protein